MKAKESPHWYKHNVLELAANRTYQRMTLEELGLYSLIREETWMHDGVPAEPATLARRLHMEEDVVRRALTDSVMSFCDIDERGGTLFCREIRAQRLEVAAKYERARQYGAYGQAVKRAKHATIEGDEDNQQGFRGQPDRSTEDP